MKNDTLTVENSEIGKHVYNLYIKPNSIVQIPYREYHRPSSFAIEKANIARKEKREKIKSLKENFDYNEPVLSEKSKRRLITAINWLVASAKQKVVFNKKTAKNYYFKINFITLTLPTTDHGISDAFFKNKLLHNFLSTCNKRYNMVNYVWKVEAQENGNIHAHITTDVFIHWREVRDVWNRILRKNGILQKYTEKHENMSLEQYVDLYQSEKISYEKLKERYEIGQQNNWTEPNTTDVHAVQKVKDLGAYLAKYFSKEDKERRRISGRVWACSYNLSEKNKLKVEVLTCDGAPELNELAKSYLEVKELVSTNKDTGEEYAIGLMYFVKLSDWGTVIKGRLLELYREHLFFIRYGRSSGMFNLS